MPSSACSPTFLSTSYGRPTLPPTLDHGRFRPHRQLRDSCHDADCADATLLLLSMPTQRLDHCRVTRDRPTLHKAL